MKRIRLKEAYPREASLGDQTVDSIYNSISSYKSCELEDCFQNWVTTWQAHSKLYPLHVTLDKISWEQKRNKDRAIRYFLDYLIGHTAPKDRFIILGSARFGKTAPGTVSNSLGVRFFKLLAKEVNVLKVDEYSTSSKTLLCCLSSGVKGVCSLDCRKPSTRFPEDEAKWKKWIEEEDFNFEKLVDRSKNQVNINELEMYLKRFQEKVGGAEVPSFEEKDTASGKKKHGEEDDEGEAVVVMMMMIAMRMMVVVVVVVVMMMMIVMMMMMIVVVVVVVMMMMMMVVRCYRKFQS